MGRRILYVKDYAKRAVVRAIPTSGVKPTYLVGNIGISKRRGTTPWNLLGFLGLAFVGGAPLLSKSLTMRIRVHTNNRKIKPYVNQVLGFAEEGGVDYGHYRGVVYD